MRLWQFNSVIIFAFVIVRLCLSFNAGVHCCECVHLVRVIELLIICSLCCTNTKCNYSSKRLTSRSHLHKLVHMHAAIIFNFFLRLWLSWIMCGHKMVSINKNNERWNHPWTLIKPIYLVFRAPPPRFSSNPKINFAFYRFNRHLKPQHFVAHSDQARLLIRNLHYR